MPAQPVISESALPPEDLQFLQDRLYEHNAAQTGKDDGQFFSFSIRNDEQEIVAGLAGWTWASACEIQTLWVHPEYRKKGYGSRLLEKAEERACSRGCQIILIGTYSFQAPGFYQKHGYEVGWRLEGFPPGHQHYYLVKRFAVASKDEH